MKPNYRIKISQITEREKIIANFADEVLISTKSTADTLLDEAARKTEDAKASISPSTELRSINRPTTGWTNLASTAC